jgi:hypothetical protein
MGSNSTTFRGARGHHHLGVRIEIDPLPVPVMGGNRGAQLRNAHHRRILVVAIEHRIRRHPPHVLRPRIVRKALAEIDRAGFPGKARHHFEHGGGQVGEQSVHAVSLMSVSWALTASYHGAAANRTRILVTAQPAPWGPQP